MEPQSNLPLNGVRVVALEQAAAAPFCSRQLADMGADVIKIERPGSGDFSREYDGALHGLSAYFAWLNRGKRSIVLDLKQAGDQAVLARLLERSDVFVHNLAPGAVERLGFSYEALSTKNPGLIWCAISGYGPDGPYRDKKAYDLLIQAESGVISLTGSAEAAAKVGISMADIAAGLYGYSSILAALLHRVKTAKGGRIEISMLECLAEWITPPLYVWMGTGRIPERVGIRHNMVAPYGAYRCADGLVNFAVQNDREWRRFCEQVLCMPAIADDPRFVSNEKRLNNRQGLESLIEDRFKSRTRAELLGALEAAGLATAAVNDVPAVAQHPQLAARRRWVNVDSPVGVIPALLPPHNLEHVAPAMGAVPALGQHTQEILTELGLGSKS
jgi:itaconate CoA-transferase